MMSIVFLIFLIRSFKYVENGRSQGDQAQEGVKSVKGGYGFVDKP